ncbi:1-aminocyclopropane-1-carboxylate deaminase/D-cysteine desulfhydrase [Flagellimonas meridianipacifica]|uniref:1-aminocyclopropane-1-carboxylate deaminase n=1 Tax=Flagellimonas meridianipacifica TaxID=1080225 RepID=A0A2T0MEP7_9FLAO|nr:pyridoxal-phosphate dependent enzyme [Allomuricauda pacifica]PRX56057.1 1-aminocyclopropane-1-carboxylate deaminase [Allomuricauda pacifica]
MNPSSIPNQEVVLPELMEKQIRLFIKREDAIHPFVSGNKYRKLKYNLQEAIKKEFDTLLTFGGAFSNHIAATAFAGKEAGLKTIGVIRGEELKNSWKENPTLKLADEHGMRLHFVSRESYREKGSPDFVSGLKETFGSFYLIPEGGTNTLAVKGCEEILAESDKHFDFICCCVGTGGTLAGLINASHSYQTVLGFPALKGDFLKEDIYTFVQKDNWKLITDYHFGGYAKINKDLVDFINQFKLKTGIPLDPIYTGKMMFGILDLVKKDFFKSGSQILAIHSGGLQGILGMNLVLKQKNLPELDI